MEFCLLEAFGVIWLFNFQPVDQLYLLVHLLDILVPLLFPFFGLPFFRFVQNFLLLEVLQEYVFVLSYHAHLRIVNILRCNSPAEHAPDLLKVLPSKLLPRFHLIK